ncbi:MAG TPA: tripartite tricarboxylate transporter TctB family protein [Longimicrobiales bacterium]
MRIKSQIDFWGGMLFIGFGLLAILVARDYPMGSAMRMGPGYFPTYIGLALVALGAWITADGFRLEGERVGSFPWRAIVLLSIGFSTFAWSIDELGFIPALAIVILTTSLAGAEFRWKEILIEMVVLTAGCWAIFIYGLELPFPLFWFSY